MKKMGASLIAGNVGTGRNPTYFQACWLNGTSFSDSLRDFYYWCKSNSLGAKLFFIRGFGFGIYSYHLFWV